VSPQRFTRTVLVTLWSGGLAAAMVALLGVPTPPPPDAGLLAHASGLLAGYLAAVMMLLMARTPVSEHRVGPDVLARWHAVGGRLFLALVLVHAGAAVASWAAARGQDLLTATVSVVGLHLLTYVGIALSFVHELGGPNLAGQPVVQVLWTLLHAYALTLVLRFRVIAPLANMWRHRLRVVAVVPEADGVVSVVMQGRHVAELGVQPGQFFRWRFLTSATWRSAHPFSLSAVPRGDLLRITVKALGTGSGLVHAVQVGTLVLPEGPSGAMTAVRRSRPSVLLIAGGVGITPLRALFESLDVAGGRVTLMYRASRPDDVIFRTELEEVARRRGGEIIWLVGPSSDPELRMTGTNLLRLVPDVADRDVYLCAAPGLSRAVRAALREVGLPARRLHEEAFSF